MVWGFRTLRDIIGNGINSEYNRAESLELPIGFLQPLTP